MTRPPCTRTLFNLRYNLHLVPHSLVPPKHPSPLRAFHTTVLINDVLRKVIGTFSLRCSSLTSFILDSVEEVDSPSSHRSQSHSNTQNQTPKSNPIHPTILSGDVTPSSLSAATLPSSLSIPSSFNESKEGDLSTTTDINDDGNTSDSSANGPIELICDDGPAPLTCDRGMISTHSSTGTPMFAFRVLQQIARHRSTASLRSIDITELVCTYGHRSQIWFARAL